MCSPVISLSVDDPTSTHGNKCPPAVISIFGVSQVISKITLCSQIRAGQLFLDWLITITLSPVSLASEAQQPSLNGNVLSIPVLVVGNLTYSIDLEIVAQTDPVEFSLKAAAEVFDVGTDGASSFAAGVLSIPAVPVGDVSYWVELTLVSDAPIIIFRLSAAGINDESDSAQSLFSDQVSASIVQTRCIVCHLQGGLAASTDLLFVNASNSDHLQINNQCLRRFSKNGPRGRTIFCPR